MPPVLPTTSILPAYQASARPTHLSPTASPPASASPTRARCFVQRHDVHPQPSQQVTAGRAAQERTATRPRPSPPPQLASSAPLDDDERTLASPAEPRVFSVTPTRNKLATLSGLVKRRRKRVPLEAKALHVGHSVDTSCWMSYVPDEAKLDELYLPGTHDSLALFYPLLSSICQSTPLLNQLKGGIRFLDLRFSLLDDGELWAYHGIVPQRLSAADAFEEVYRWLEGEGRSECVVVSCKQENPAPHFAETLWALLDRTSRSRALWYDEDRWPSLGEVRGKCVMFCRFGWDTQRGLHPPEWPNDSRAAWRTTIGGRDTLVQDWYGLSTPIAIPKKAALALSLFTPDSPLLPPSSSAAKTTATDARPHPLSTPDPLPHRISYLSCASFPLLFPSVAAKGFGAPSLGLGWRGVNELVLRGLRRLAATDAATAAAVAAGVGEGKDEGAGGGARARGRRYVRGEGGMVVLLDFWESTADSSGRGRDAVRQGGLVLEVVQMNFAA
ncbi:hypothetical protein JCM3775_003212 [Rhodotorula graminis]|uniref:Phosphatidylinositol-specific phospholipase C X domain-containing protein n=1 Tax=Rhodotorula graminis (strain WP1) TaxID=578459 RepID=A0A194S977_RHOGW|nr:uncharacterized protein RHOBADRAFT_52099 [Rhodotorula graminis WP1]KPV77152.1 hypothetical protein RHOBADRAFT_52099 [Rhodotorula graminis WP1]